MEKSKIIYPELKYIMPENEYKFILSTTKEQVGKEYAIETINREFGLLGTVTELDII